jgi:fumarate hydratase class II
MGEVQVPADAYYGASTQRAVQNFPISDLRFGKRFIWALGLIKGSAAEMNKSMGHVDAETADAIIAAADEVMQGQYDDQFVVDIFQTGSGTSTNMNINEVPPTGHPRCSEASLDRSSSTRTTMSIPASPPMM